MKRSARKFSEEVHPKKLLEALHEAHAQLDELGLRHALIGGLAMDLHAEPRATKDIDFLVESAGRAALTGMQLAIDGITYRVRGKIVDALFASDADEDALLSSTVLVEDVPVLDAAGTCLLKLRSGRTKDRQDIFAMLDAGTLDEDALRKVINLASEEEAEEIQGILGEALLQHDR